MSLSQALSAALSGVNTTQQGLSVIAGNVANANTPGYVDESVNQVEVGTVGAGGTSVETSGINRNLNQLLQSQLWTETSGGSYADMTVDALSAAAEHLRHAEFVDARSTRSTTISPPRCSRSRPIPESSSAQSAVVGAAQSLAQNLNSMTAGIQQIRTQAEQGISNDVQSANTLIQQIAQINGQLESSSSSDGAPRRSRISATRTSPSSSQLMNVRVVQNPDNQISVFTGNGQQLVANSEASQLSFDNAGTLSATAQWSADPSQDGVGTITLTVPGGSSTDLLADGAIQSGEIAAYVQMRDNILPQAQTQLDEMANQMSQALSNQTTAGTAVASGGQAGYSVDVGSLLPGNTVTLSYTDGANTQHTVTIVALGAGGSLPQSSANATNPVIGVNFSAGMSAAVSQLNAALGTNLQFSNPSGTVLQVLNNGGTNTVNSLSATSTVTSLSSGSAQLPLFTDSNGAPITGADHRETARK